MATGTIAASLKRLTATASWTVPTGPPDWAVRVSDPAVHAGPPRNTAWEGLVQDQVRGLRDNLLRSILSVFLQSVRGLFIPGTLQDVLDQLTDWADDVPILGDLIEVFTGIEDGDLSDLGTWVNGLGDELSDLVERTIGIGPGMVSDATVGTHATNLLLNALFDTADTVISEGGWSWDGTTGKTTNGSAKATAAGAERVMLSNRIQVEEGDNLDLSVWAKCASLSYTGSNPICLGVSRYDSAMSLLGSTDVAVWASPSATETWTQLSESYAVPAGTSYLRLRLKVSATATSGSVWFDEASAVKTGGVKDASVPGIGVMLGNVMLGLEDLAGVDINHDGALGAYQTTAAAMRANSSAITYLQSLLTAGVSAVDDFERDDDNSMGGNWSQDYSGSGAGYMETDGHAVKWDPSGWGIRTCLSRWTGTNSVSNTDTQKVLAVLGSKGQNNTLLSKCGYNYLLGRMNTAGTHYILATFGADGEVALGYVAGGSYVQWATTDVATPPGMGATISLECGYGGDSRYYVARINDQIILAWDESGTASSMGASYRGWGCGMKAEGDLLLLTQMLPAKFNSWAAWDN
jgi:hypothetical protein